MANPTIRRIKCVLGTAIGNQIIPLVTLIIIDIPVVFDKQFCQLKNCSADNSLSMTSNGATVWPLTLLFRGRTATSLKQWNLTYVEVQLDCSSRTGMRESGVYYCKVDARAENIAWTKLLYVEMLGFRQFIVSKSYFHNHW